MAYDHKVFGCAIVGCLFLEILCGLCICALVQAFQASSSCH